MRQKSDAGIALTLVGFEAKREPAKNRLQTSLMESLGCANWLSKVSPEQEKTTEDKREENYGGACECERRPNPTAVDHQTSLQIPVSWRDSGEKQR
jgi:hypothetical protein